MNYLKGLVIYSYLHSWQWIHAAAAADLWLWPNSVRTLRQTSVNKAIWQLQKIN